jgi:hypothetical protein
LFYETPFLHGARRNYVCGATALARPHLEEVSSCGGLSLEFWDSSAESPTNHDRKSLVLMTWNAKRPTNHDKKSNAESPTNLGHEVLFNETTFSASALEH